MDIISPPLIQKDTALRAVCCFLVKGTGFGLRAYSIEEGNESVSDPKETECPSPVHDKLLKGQEVLGRAQRVSNHSTRLHCVEQAGMSTLYR